MLIGSGEVCVATALDLQTSQGAADTSDLNSEAFCLSEISRCPEEWGVKIALPR